MPRISVVIATLGRPEVLARTLGRLERQRGCDGDFEVVVVSDAAERDVASVAAAIGSRPYPLRHLHGETPGVSATRNRGWRSAEAPLVLFIGDDMLPLPRLVAEHLDWHARNPGDEVAVLGHVRWARELRVTPFMRWVERGLQFDYDSIQGREAGWWHLYAANASVARSRLELAGGFDESFRFGYEELDLAIRMNELGLRVLYNPRAVVEHLHPATIEGWRRRMEVVARAERQFTAKHPGTEAYFKQIFERASALPPARGRGARLAGVIPRRTPLLGRRVWDSADAWFAQQLAPAFLSAWDDRAHSRSISASSSGSSPGGPK